MTNMSTGKVRKVTEKNYSPEILRKTILSSHKSINSLTKFTNIEFNSLRRVNALTTPLATIWQLSKAFGTTVDKLLNCSWHKEYKGLNFDINNQTFLPFIPQKYFFEFLLNTKLFIEHQALYFFTHPELTLSPGKTYVCTFLKEQRENKTLHRLAVIELDPSYKPKENDMVVFKHKKYHLLFFGTYIKSGDDHKIMPTKAYKKPVFDFEDIDEIFGKVLKCFEIRTLSEDYPLFNILKKQTLKQDSLCKDSLKSIRQECSRVFFENVTKILSSKKIPLNALSRAIGKNMSILREARKKQHSIRIETALKISKYLNTSLDELLSGLGSKEDATNQHDKLHQKSSLIPLINWEDFCNEAFSKHVFFSVPKIIDNDNLFALKNNLKQSLSNKFPQDAIFIIGKYKQNTKGPRHLFLKDRKEVAITKAIFSAKKKIHLIFINQKWENFEEHQKKVLGEIVCVINQ